MSLFDFLAPEVAEASHLRDISESLRAQNHARSLHHNTTAQTNREISNIHSRLDDLEAENGILSLLVVSLLKQLSEHTDITMKQVFDQLKEIDLLDGAQDGKVSLSSLRLMFGLEVAEPESKPEPTAPNKSTSEFWICTNCNHRNVAARTSCLYCGATKF